MNKALTEATALAPYSPANVPELFGRVVYSPAVRPLLSLPQRSRRPALNAVPLAQIAPGFRTTFTAHVADTFRLTAGKALLVLTDNEGHVVWAYLDPTRHGCADWPLLKGLNVTILGRKRLPNLDIANEPVCVDVLELAVAR